jgi:integrase
LADVAVNKIDKSMIVDTFSGLYKDHPAQALRALRMCKKVLDYAEAKDMRSGPNPARWRDNLEHIFPEPKIDSERYPHLPFQEVPELISRLRLREGNSARALEFEALTASRPGEAREMPWSEVDWENRIWSLPKERTKQDRPHRVPLSDRCMEILVLQKKLQNEYGITTDYVFTGYRGEGLSEKSMREQLKRMDLPVHVVPSGFRKSFRNWAARARINGERVDRDLAELSIGHKVKGKVEEAYWTEDAIDERRPIMQAWAEFISVVT